MARRPRIHIPGAFYHITLRGNHRQRIFNAPSDPRLLSDIVAESIERLPARVHAYCWMTNHMHMIMQASDAPVGRVVLRIASRYARVVQGRLSTTGHLFERRYHAVLIDADSYLLSLLRYIHLNPVRAGIVSNVADYEWSSHHAYAGCRVDSWVTTEFALDMWSHNRVTAIERYRAFMDSRGALRRPSPLERVNQHDSRVLGDDAFVQRMSDVPGSGPANVALERIITAACNRFSVARDEIDSPGRLRRLTRVRAWIAYEATTQRVASVSQVAMRLKRCESSIRELLLRHYPERPGSSPGT